MSSFAPVAAPKSMRIAVKAAIKATIGETTQHELGNLMTIVCRQAQHVAAGNQLQNDRPLKRGVTVSQILRAAEVL